MIRINKLLFICMFMLCFITVVSAQNKVNNATLKKSLTEILHIVSQRKNVYINFNPQITNRIFLDDSFTGKDAIAKLNKSIGSYDLEIKGANSRYLYVRPIKKFILKGYLVDEKSMASIPDTKVILAGQTSVKSDLNGNFSFTLRKGVYLIKVNADSYYPKNMKVVVNESENVTVMLKKKIKKAIVVTPIKKKDEAFSATKDNKPDQVLADRKLAQLETINNSSEKSSSDTVLLLPRYFSRYALKTNILLWGNATPNVSIERRLNKNVSVDLLLAVKKVTSDYESQSLSYLIQPEIRYWFSNCFNGFNIGYHMYYSNYGAGDIIFPFQRKGLPNDLFYQGYLYGMGASVGYQKRINKHFAVEGVIGTGYIHLAYDQITWNSSWHNKKSLDYNYWGLTKAAVNLVYLF